MCGIVAYIGEDNHALNRVFEGLLKLEYRGYDSWGIFGFGSKNLIIRRVGKISQYQKERWPLTSLAIGHTRWATHGGITKVNTHPHLSQSKRLIMVHNGIVENFLEIKIKLEQKGYSFISETDTEVVANYFDDLLMRKTLNEALNEGMKLIEGRNAFVIYDTKEKKLIGFRNGSPLTIGIARDGLYLSSDVSPFIKDTSKVIFLDDGEGVIIDETGEYDIWNLQKKKKVRKDIQSISWEVKDESKGDKKYFLEKEIYEQQFVLQETLKQDRSEVRKIVNVLRSSRLIYCTGAGTAGRVGSWGAGLLQKIGKRQAISMVSSEFGRNADFISKEDVMIVISQSGETADTLEAMKIAQEKKVKIIALVNVEGSTIARQADFVLYHKVGPEKAVASTKATTAPMVLFYLLSSSLGEKSVDGKKELQKMVKELSNFVTQDLEQRAKDLAKKIMRQENIYLIGRGLSFPIAQEGGIKIQELSNVHAEGIAAGELKHYAISLIEPEVPCFVIVGEEGERKQILSNAMEVKSRGGFIIGFDSENQDVFDDYFALPDLGILKGIFTLISLQMIAYHLALLRGCDPDYCRNLAKSVTVI